MGKLEFFHLRDTCAKVLETSLRKLGVEKLSKDDVQKMQWEVLEAKIGSWIHFTRIDVLKGKTNNGRWVVYNEENGIQALYRSDILCCCTRLYRVASHRRRISGQVT
ncbi:uncharacterized protein LOC113287962 isoform X2 [Papaver somniferum]|uniref:uncharacterized protein LOC113287962 isoform X2 n=1 Tax=Papaver somniferum TaxID=3469 RepID=UPI000E7017CE|nr:uncharacterized protein LOC113287962 isoform X2 [Papaver somniferum]